MQTKHIQAAALPAAFIQKPSPAQAGDGLLAVWCPWCETVHTHGAAGRGAEPRTENRGADCSDLARSPFAETGYDLAVTGQTTGSVDGVVPDAHMARAGLRLWRRLDSGWPGIARSVMAAVLGRKRMSCANTIRLADGSQVDVWIQCACWSHFDGARGIADGLGLIGLISHLFGVPAGVVSVRLLEAINGHPLDASAAQAVANIINQWSARGSPVRKGAA